MLSHRMLNQLALVQLDGIATIDLRELEWVTPAVMTGAAALARARVDAGQRVALRGPRSEQVMGYLARMRFGRVLRELGVEHDVTLHARARDRHRDLLELSPVSTDEQAQALAELVYTNVARVDDELAGRLFASLGEVGGNVADHAQAVGYMAAQKMPSTNELHIAVADGGVGLLHWLGPARGADSHRQALTMALKGVSRHVDFPEAGGGIVRTLALVAAMSGDVLVASGDAWSVDSSRGRRRGYLRAAFNGTLFQAAIPLGPRLLP